LTAPCDIISLYRSRLAEETGAVRKDWGGRRSIALAYPNYYRLGMSNLGFQILYRLLNQRSGVVAERVFLPEGQEMSLYLRSGKPLLSLESQTPLYEFDLVAFSLSFENDYPNVLKILELGGIPLSTEERTGPMPLVMAGGITTFLNPEPLSPFVDAFLLGEAEANLDAFMDVFLEFNRAGPVRKEFLACLARNVPGLYAPLFYQTAYHTDGTLKAFLSKEAQIPEKIRVVRPSNGGFSENGMPVSTITTPGTEFSNKVLVEVGRGCGHSCRFCAAGYVYRPPRSYDDSQLCAAVQKAMERTGQVGLVSPAVSDVPGIEALTALILERGGTFSVSSLRAETLTQGLLDNLKSAGQKTITIAPEAGSERLRRTINKHLTREQIFDAICRVSRTGDFSLRLYFLIGLPTETDDDIRQIVELVKGIRHHMVKESAARGTIGRIRLSVNCFVPKPFTPFQWFPLEDVGSLKKKQKWLKKALAKAGGIDVGLDVPKWAYIQTLLSMGDRRVGSILLLAHQSAGDWTRALKHTNINPDFFVYRPRGIDERLPWDFIDNGILKRHLIKEHDLALKAEESDICHVGECRRCGVCAGSGHSH
jgi:radical SAM superfamily enzyme YgiQ (UPF0313 family)